MFGQNNNWSKYIMKKLICILLTLLTFNLVFAYEKTKTDFHNGLIGSSTSPDGKFYVAVYRENNVDSAEIFLNMPEAPEGFHLIAIETYIIMEGKDHIKRVYTFTNDDSIKSFSVTSCSQTEL